MSDLQDRLRTAGNLARLQSIIDLTRDQSSLPVSLPDAERRWFACLLSPFAVGDDARRKIAALPSTSTAAPPISDLVTEILETHAEDLKALSEEFQALVSLLQKLLGPGATLDAGETRRVHEIAIKVRRRLLQEHSFHRDVLAESRQRRASAVD
jgi:hypothetical protein